MGKRREIRIKVHGDRKPVPDTRKMARAIVRLAVEQGTESAQVLADQLEHDEAVRRQGLTRARKDQRAESGRPRDEKRRRAS